MDIINYLGADESLHEAASGISKHINLRKNIWAFTLWKGENVSINPHTVIKDNEKLLYEWANDLQNGTHNGIEPIKFEGNDNVILLQGMKESIDRDINASSTHLNWSSLGNDNTAESESQTDLTAEFSDSNYARKVFSSAGSRSRINQTMRLGMLWDDSSFDATPRSIKEAGIHWHLSDASKCHARVVSTTFTLNAGDLFVVQINELQENGTL